MDFNLRGCLDERIANFLSADAHVWHDHAGNVLVNGQEFPATVVDQVYGAATNNQQEVNHG